MSDIVERLRRKSNDKRETSPATMIEAADEITALRERLREARQFVDNYRMVQVVKGSPHHATDKMLERIDQALQPNGGANPPSSQETEL